MRTDTTIAWAAWGLTLALLVTCCAITAEVRADIDFRLPRLPKVPVTLEGEGPYGGDIRGILPMGSDGLILWTGDAGPFVRWADEERWRPAREGLPVTNGRILVTAMASCESQPGFLAAAFLDGWVFASEDGGESWGIVGLVPARGEMVRELIVHPGDPNRIMAATRRKVFLSEDQGRSWTELLHAMSASDMDPWMREDWTLQFVHLLVDRLRPGTALLMTRDQGTLQTKNWGHDVDWFRMNLPGPVDAAALDPTIGAIVYAASGGDLHRSVDGGETWEIVAWSGRGVLGRVSSLIVDPGYPSRLIALSAGQNILRVSYDGGLTWAPRDLPPGEEARVLAVHPMGVDHGLLLGTNRGLWESKDGGASWQFASQGIRDVTVLDLAPGPAGPRSYWAAADRGLALFDLQDGVWDWYRGHPVLPEKLIFSSAPQTARWILGEGGLWNLEAAGSTRLVEMPSADREPTDAALWAGRLWVCGSSPESIWIAHKDDEQLLRLRGICHREDEMMDPWLRVDPCNGDRIYLGFGPLLESTDGETWAEVFLPLDVRWVWDATRVFNGCGDFLLATDRGVYLQEEADGYSWRHVGPGEFEIQEILADPLQPGRWFARTLGVVYLTEDGGDTWRSLDLPWGQVTAMSWDVSSERLLVGLQDEGIRWVHLTADKELGIRVEPINVSPNPFQDEAAVSLQIHESAPYVELRIYSISGDLVRTVRRGGPFSPGSLFQWTWDGTSDDGQRVATGVYVFRATLAGRPYGGKALRMR